MTGLGDNHKKISNQDQPNLDYVSSLGANAIKSWNIPTNYDEYPEAGNKNITQKHSFGIALSGGGMRAACNAIAWLHAFHHKDAVAEARYVSVNSGASWVTNIAIFAASANLQNEHKNSSISDATDEPLHEAGPRDLANAKFLLRIRQGIRSSLRSHNCEWYLNVIHYLCGVAHEEPDERPASERNFWCRAVEEFMFAHGQEDPEYIAFDEDFDDTNKDSLPFLIVAGALMTNQGYCLPFEFTPTYCGVPVVDKTPGSDSPQGFIEPFAFDCNYANAKGVDSRHAPQLYIKRIYPATGRLMRMSDVSGISSSAAVQIVYELYKGSIVNRIVKFFGIKDQILSDITPKFHFWAPKKISDEQETYRLVGGKFDFSDGGDFIHFIYSLLGYYQYDYLLFDDEYFYFLYRRDV